MTMLCTTHVKTTAMLICDKTTRSTNTPENHLGHLRLSYNLYDLKWRFHDNTMKLLTLSLTVEPKNICKLIVHCLKIL